MTQPDIELVLDAHADTGESPTWCAAQQALFWVDIKQPALHRFDPADGSDRHWLLPSHVGCFALNEAGDLAVLGLRTGVFQLDLARGDLTQLAPSPFDSNTHRFNEGGCDATGRFWLGVMFEPLPGVKAEPQPGVLHSYSPSEGLRAHDDATLTPNGIAWTADGATMFLAHSKEHRVFTFAFDARAGRLGERRLFAAIPDDMGVPDGAALDSEGCYWSAIHRGGRLRRYRPDGQLDREIMMPVSCPTMCSFAGPALDTLYITTASHGSSAEPHAGALYRCRPGVTGLAKPNYAV